MSTSSQKKPSFNKNNYLSKNELLSWINDLLKVNLTLVEQLGSGTMYCQIMDVIYPGQIQLSKVKWGAKLEYDFIHNLKILQQCFDKLQIPQAIQVNKLAKVKYQDNLEFAQWLKAYFDFNCKEKGKGYDAVKRRGNAVPYFGFCKGGVLPKTTLFYRNPNEKFSIEGFSNDEIDQNNNEDQEQQIGQYNNINQFKPATPTSSYHLPQQNSFFSSKEGSASKLSTQMNSFIQAPVGITNFFAREEGVPLKNQTPQQIKMTQSEIKPSFFSNGISPMNIAQTEGKRQYQSQYYTDQVPRKLNFFKTDGDDEEKVVSQQLNQKNNNIFFNGFQQQSVQQQSQAFSGSRQPFNPTLFNSNYQNNSASDNKLNNNYLNSNIFTRNNPSIIHHNSSNITTDQLDKKPSSLATSVLLNKIQELTQASQTLLRRNSEEGKKSRSVNKLDIQEEQGSQSLEKNITPQSKRLHSFGEEHKSPFYETPIQKKLKDNYSAAVIVQNANENSTDTFKNQNDQYNNNTENVNQEINKTITTQIIENHQNQPLLPLDSTSTLNSQSDNEAAKKKVERISSLLSSYNSDDYSQIISLILKICQES